MRSLRIPAIAVLFALSAATAGAQRVKVGAPAPEINLATLSGSKVQLSRLRGHPVVVSYWATWCPSCRSEMTELVRVVTAHGAAGLRVLSINGLDQEHDKRDLKQATRKVQAFVDAFALPFEVALDKRGSVRQAYGILVLPTTLFIDAAGVVQGIHSGTINGEELDRGIAKIHPPR